MYMLISTFCSNIYFLYIFTKYWSYHTLGFENFDYIFRKYIENLAIKPRNEKSHEVKIILTTH